MIISTLALAWLQYHPISEVRWGTTTNPLGYLSSAGTILTARLDSNGDIVVEV
ncbi:MAG: hypothetical protein QMD14_06090 [Candidatus Aenigmarchaeota archaeon]|nr:hypothetical protein [Candidatus Aenigmarchaeota archaeon]